MSARLKEQNAQLGDVQLAQKAEAMALEAEQMDRVAASPAAKSAYIKRSKQRLYLSQKGKRGLIMLKEGDVGLEVERLQKALAKAGLYKGPIDGKFSEDLTEAVKSFQNSKHLKSDGMAGPRTLGALGLY